MHVQTCSTGLSWLRHDLVFGGRVRAPVSTLTTSYVVAWLFCACTGQRQCDWGSVGCGGRPSRLVGMRATGVVLSGAFPGRWASTLTDASANMPDGNVDSGQRRCLRWTR